MDHADLSPDARAVLEARCRRAVVSNLVEIGKQIGPRHRMLQMVSEYGVVETLRRLPDEWTSGWTDLYNAHLLGLSAEATIVESTDFRRLFNREDILRMESDLRDAGYNPKSPS